jgi:hypothetical protein
MKITESFPSIFDRVPKVPCSVGNLNLWTVNERNASCKIKQLRVSFTANDFLCLDEVATKQMQDVTTSRSSFFVDDECDGIGIFQTEAGITMVFVDLKSNFDTNKIQHGFAQSLASLIKMHSMLSLCDGYNLADTSLEFVVACCCFPDEDKETKVLDWMLRQRTSDPGSFVAQVAYPLYDKGSIQVKIGDFPQLSTLPLNGDLYNKNVKLTLVRSAQYTDNYVDYTL